jgi:hypothetical protein
MFVREKPAESLRELCEDSKSYPRKSLRPPLAPETISVHSSDTDVFGDDFEWILKNLFGILNF